MKIKFGHLAALLAAAIGVGVYVALKPNSKVISRVPNGLIRAEVLRIESLKPSMVSFTFHSDCESNLKKYFETTDPVEISAIAKTLADSNREVGLEEPFGEGNESLIDIVFHGEGKDSIVGEFSVILPAFERFWGKPVREMIEKRLPDGWAIHASKKSMHYPALILGPVD